MEMEKTKQTSEPVLHALILNDGTVIPAAQIKILKNFGFIPTSETREDQTNESAGKEKHKKYLSMKSTP